jgi:HEAT repeat protein
MELPQIETQLSSSNPQQRMQALTALRKYELTVAIPLLKSMKNDQEFIVRSFVAASLGYKQSDEGFAILVDFIENDKDSNVRAEAANALSKYGEPAMLHLVKLFQKDSAWLVRQSIFAVMEAAQHPEIFLELCAWGLEGEDFIVRQSAIENLQLLATTSQATSALNLLLKAANSAEANIRLHVAKVLQHFDDPRIPDALIKLRQDTDYRVVGATLEALI